MPTVSDFRDAYDVQPNTIRTWTSTFAEFLSDGANPPKGEHRSYTDDDGRVIDLIATMRNEQKSYEEIRAALAEGDRGQWPQPDTQDAQDRKERDQNTFALVTQLTARAASLEGELGAIKEERDHLRNQLQDAQATVQDAQKRAVEAETELRILREVTNKETAAQGEKTSFWQRLFGR